MIRFGVSGNSQAFYDNGLTRTIDAAKWCSDQGIELFEYSFGRGINISQETAIEIGNEFRKYNVLMSIHSPYYINMANPDPKMIEKSLLYIKNSMVFAEFMQADRVVVHPASQGKLDRKEANIIMKANINNLSERLEEEFPRDILICWETMGKTAQMGTVDEIIEICSMNKRFFPCIDFGHINAREQGVLNKPGNYNTIIEKLKNNLDYLKFINMHVHFSKIQFSEKGEIKHLTFADDVYGPNFKPLAELFFKYNMAPHVVCESDGTQAEDSIEMKKIYYSIVNSKDF